jgi:hypothetical protein
MDGTQTREKRVSKQQNDAGASRLRVVRDTDPRVGWRKESGQWTGDFVIATACRIYVRARSWLCRAPQGGVIG